MSSKKNKKEMNKKDVRGDRGNRKKKKENYMKKLVMRARKKYFPIYFVCTIPE